MEQLWSAEALRAHWVLSPKELGLLKGMSLRRSLVLGYYLKSFQRYARFPRLSDPVPEAIADFLGGTARISRPSSIARARSHRPSLSSLCFGSFAPPTI